MDTRWLRVGCDKSDINHWGGSYQPQILGMQDSQCNVMFAMENWDDPPHDMKACQEFNLNFCDKIDPT